MSFEWPEVIEVEVVTAAGRVLGERGGDLHGVVARRHATIESTAQGYVLKSLAPSGRTKVNGVIVGDTQTLHDGDRIELGQTLLVFRQR